ncbi:phosphatase PAP2 family protein [Legionella oakridgensis]|uniref:phosphatase PAP2 family protein n=1 Tax=Legionella oakridgensis TaxID=29423 RepID=UPI00046D293E
MSSFLVAWARIYVGVHFPFDMLGGAIVALLSTSIIIYISPLIHQYVFPLSEQLHSISICKINTKTG